MRAPISILFLTGLVLMSGSLSLAQSPSGSKKNNQVDASQDIDGLGGNEGLMHMANTLDPENRSRIVQKRIVDLNDRFEFGLNYGAVAGGDPYMETQSMGASMDFHFNPHYALGVRYYNYGNTLTAEGQRVFSEAQSAYNAGGRSYVIPDIDYPLQSAMAMATWSPIYGKINMFDAAITQFDIYAIGGGGSIQMSSGWTPIWTAGGGFAFWASKHFSIRTELRYQNYHDEIITGPRNIDTVVGSLGLGLLL